MRVLLVVGASLAFFVAQVADTGPRSSGAAPSHAVAHAGDAAAPTPPPAEADDDVAAAYSAYMSSLVDGPAASGNEGTDADAEGIAEVPDEALTAVVQRVCTACHNDQLLTGNLSLQGFDVSAAAATPEKTERMIRKLRAGMMPPPGIPRPEGDTMQALVETLEARVDEAVAAKGELAGRSFQRLNATEYERSIADVLGLEVRARDYLPLDTRSANFDNIADVQLPSPTVMDGYLKAAGEISRLALGDRNATSTSTTYAVPRLASQWDRVEGAPRGTRGGISVIHNFPADGEYVFRMGFQPIPTGGLSGQTAPFDEHIEVSIDGERAALLEIDRWMSQSDPQGLNLETEPIFVRAGPQRVSAAFLQTFDGPINDIISPIGHSIADTQIGSEYGITSLAHLREVVIAGPERATGISETPSRRRVFICRPTSADEARPCAGEIVANLASKAYRRPVTDGEVERLLSFYDTGVEQGGFEIGVRTALEAILASPHFVFRLEREPAGMQPGESYVLSDVDLASRLSFFLWGTPPDEELEGLARAGKLADPEVLQAHAKRMLADPRSESLGSRFAAQWLRLQDLDLIHPDALLYPDFHKQVADAMRRETELFFWNLVREDRSALELFTADYTYVNERLARHYGIPDVRGGEFRRVSYPEGGHRSGLLGHGSVLTLTSVANRTSPVLRGKWVMEVLLGTPPPPPPPGVPDLEETEGVQEGRRLTTRERMEQHRANPVCNACHQFMDPIGLALDAFDVTGQWRITEEGLPLDTRGDFYDGTRIESPEELRDVLLRRPTPLMRTLTENLMAYALGRRVEAHDQPTVRAIEREAAGEDYRMSRFILGVVGSDAFRMKRAEGVAVEEEAEG